MKNSEKAGEMTNSKPVGAPNYYQMCVDLCASRGHWATRTALVEEGRPDDGTDWKAWYEDWSRPEPVGAPNKRHSAPHVGPCGICGSDDICEHDVACASAVGAPAPTQTTPDESMIQRRMRHWQTLAENAEQKLLELGWMRMNSGGYERVADAPAVPQQAELCAHECGIEDNHEWCICAKCLATKPRDESWTNSEPSTEQEIELRKSLESARRDIARRNALIADLQKRLHAAAPAVPQQGGRDAADLWVEFRDFTKHHESYDECREKFISLVSGAAPAVPQHVDYPLTPTGESILNRFRVAMLSLRPLQGGKVSNPIEWTKNAAAKVLEEILKTPTTLCQDSGAAPAVGTDTQPDYDAATNWLEKQFPYPAGPRSMTWAEIIACLALYKSESVAAVGSTTPTPDSRILDLAQEMLNAERAAVQNAEYGNEKAVEKHQRVADTKMDEIKAALATPTPTTPDVSSRIGQAFREIAEELSGPAPPTPDWDQFAREWLQSKKVLAEYTDADLLRWLLRPRQPRRIGVEPVTPAPQPAKEEEA